MMNSFKIAILISTGFTMICGHALAETKSTVPSAELSLTPGNPADEALVDIVALPEYCKKIQPERAAEFEARITAAVAKQEANIQALIATPEFAAAVAKSVIKMGDTKEPDDVAFLKMACSEMPGKE